MFHNLLDLVEFLFMNTAEKPVIQTFQCVACGTLQLLPALFVCVTVSLARVFSCVFGWALVDLSFFSSFICRWIPLARHHRGRDMITARPALLIRVTLRSHLSFASYGALPSSRSDWRTFTHRCSSHVSVWVSLYVFCSW